MPVTPDAHTFRLREALAAALALLLPALSGADPFPPTWGPPNEPAGPVHFAPVAWPNEPANPADCGTSCGDWLPYSRFQNSLNDPRVRDPSNGGTSPQNYVNVASSCIDTQYPSIYYSLRRGAAPDGSQDVILFRWRVEQIANTYATGPNPGSFGATDPWNSALWTVFFDIDGDGFRDLAAHLNGASGSPSSPVDLIAGIWGNVPTQSLDYVNDPNIKLIAHNPTAFVQGGAILNFQNSLNPTTNWGSAPRTVWDYGTSRSRLVSTNACNEYFIDYQIPTRMLDASPTGPNPALNGPKITRSTPISMMFCTANSLNNPTQKDCAINNRYTSSTPVPGPFGDYLSFDQDDPYSQPIISSVTATAPNTCPGSYQLGARVQDTLALDNGNVVSSVKAVDFYYWRDANNNGQADEAGGVWTRIAPTATLAPGSRNQWRTSWDATGLPRGAYLVGVQAVDDRTRVDLDMPPAARDNRTFSYVTGNVQGQVYVDGSWASPAIQGAFPSHSPPQNPVAGEDWYGNPEVTGQQIAIIDVAINACGEAPTVSKSATPSSVATGEPVGFGITLTNSTSQSISFDRIDDSLPTGFSYQSTASISNDGAPLTASTSPTPGATGAIAWTFPATTVLPGRAVVLNFTANAGSTAGTFNNTASARTGLGTFASPPTTVGVDAARISLSKTPNIYSVNPDGSTQVIYSLRYSNDSSVTLTNAVITDPLPAGTTFVSCSGGSSCGFSAPNVSWQLGTLAGGASGTVELRLTVNTNYASTTLVNTASLAVTPPGGGSVSSNASSTIRVNVPAPAFTLRKSSPTVQVAPGGNITWTLDYSNYGTGAASSVVLTDTLPDGFSFVSCSVAASTHFSPCSQLNGIVTFNAASVPAGASGSVSITATAAGAPFPFANPAVNNASLTWSGNSTPVTASATVGVTGQACSAVYYLEAGASPTTSLLNATPPPRARTGSTVGLWTSQSAVFTSPVLSSPVALANRILSVRIFVDSAANRQMTIQVDRVSSGIPTLIASFAQNMPNAPQVFTFSTAAFGAGTAPLAAGEQLRLTFTGNGNTSQRIGLFYDGTQTFGGASTYTDSLTSICSSSSPAALNVAKRVDRANVTSLPAALQYTIDFSNPGGVAATGAQITDALPANVTLNSVLLNGVLVTPTPTVTAQQFSVSVNTTGQAAGTLAAGGSGSLVVNATATASASGTLTNTAQLNATGLSPVSSSTSTLVGTPGPSSPPVLSLSKSVDRSLLGAGDIATYSLTVVNTGGSAANSVVVTDDFPDAAYFSYLDCTAPSGQSCSQSPVGVLSWNVGSLAAGQAATLSFRMQVAATGVPAGVTQRDNFATASSATYCTSPAVSGCTSNTVPLTISGAPRLALSKSVSPPGPHSAGDLLTYTLNLSNTGSSTAEGVRVIDPVPTYTSFVGVISASSGSGSFDASENRVVFELPSLAAGASASLSFQVRTVRPLPQGSTTITNSATASAANASPVSASVSSSANAQPLLRLDKQGAASLPYPAASLSATASASTTVFVDSSARLTVGDRVLVGGAVRRVTSISGRAVTLDAAVSAAAGAPLAQGLTYSLIYANDGGANASNVVLSDTLPANLVYAGASVTPNTQPPLGSSGALSFNLGTLAAGASGQLQVYAIPTAAGSYTNAASLSATGVPAVNDTVTTAAGGLVLDKRTTTPVRVPGSQAEYVLSVRNTGAALISGIAVTDVLPSGFSYASTVHVRINGIDVVPLSSPSAGSGFPAWSSFDLAGGQTLEIRFFALVGADVGPATYDNGFEVTAPGAAITPFDPLATSAEDVTVLGPDQGLVEGVVYTDIDGNGVFDPTVDLPIAGAEVQVGASNGVVYIALADGEGRFQRVVPAGTTLVSVAESTLPAGLVPTIGSDGENPNSVIVPAGGSARDNNGFVPTTGAIGNVAGRVFDDTGVENGVQDPGESGRLGVLVELRDAVSGNLIRTTYTDLLGDYSFNNVAPANYMVRVQRPSGSGFSPSTPNDRPVTVVDGGTARADFGLIVAVTVDADLRIAKSNGAGFVIAGSTTVYSLVIDNLGPSSADAASVFDPIAAGLNKTAVACVASSGGAVCPPTPSVAAIENGTLLIPTLPSGGSITLEVTATVTAAAGATVTNAASVAPPDGVTDPVSTNNSASDSDPVQAPPMPGLSFAKTATLNDSVTANGTADAGESIGYTLTATNTGNVAITGVVVSDPRLPALSCTPAQPANLAVGASITCTGSYTVLQSDIDAQMPIANTATADSNETPPIQDTATVPVTAAGPGLSFSKTASLNDSVTANGTADAGESIGYALTVTNTGNVALTGVVVSDPRLPALGCTPAQPASLAVGTSITCTGSYTVLQSDIDSQVPIANTATADSNETPPIQDTATVPVTAAGPGLSFSKTASLNDSVTTNGTADAGESIGYTLTATNSGNVSLSGVTIVDPRLPSLSCTPSQPAALAVGAAITCTGSYTVLQSDIDAQVPITNTATANSNETPQRQDAATVPVTSAGPQLGFTKIANLGDTVLPNGTADAGESISYTLTATNGGNVGLTGVVISDPRLPALSCTPAQPASLAVGAELVCIGSYVVLQADVDGQTPITNTATAASNETPPRQDAATVPVTAAGPQLGLTKVANLSDTVIANGTADAGETISYTLTATNGGNVGLTGVVISDPRLPSLSCTPAQPANLAVGASITCTGNYTVLQSDIDAQVPIANTATADSNETSPSQDTATVPVTAAGPGLSFSKTASLNDSVTANGTADAGETISYTLTATNGGNVGLTGVVISDPRLPTLSCTPAQPASLAVGASITCTGSYTALQSDIDAQVPIANTATADSNETAAVQDTATVLVTAAGPQLAFTKAATLNDTVTTNGTADAGESIGYTLTATNSGNVSLSGVTIVDPRLPSLSCTPTQPAVLAVGASVTCTGSYAVTQSDVDAQTAITNIATADSNETPPRQDAATVPVTVAGPQLGLTKIANLVDTILANGTADAGESIGYTLTATNAGNISLSGVVIVDPRLPSLSCTPAQPASLAVGAELVCTGSYLVLQSDIDAQAPITNTAEASSNETPPRQAAATVPVTAAGPQLGLTKVANLSDTVIANGTADAGETISYTLTATNGGNVGLTGVVISDPRLPSLSCTPAQPANLAVGASITCTGSYTVLQSDIDAQVPIANTATADSNETSPSQDTATVPVTAAGPGLSFSKTASLNDSVTANGTADAGESISYTLTATNSGNVGLTGVVITDPRLPSLSCTPAQPATLAVGASITCTGSYTVLQSDIDAQVPIANTATADSNETPPIQDTATVPVTAAGPALSFVKTATLNDTVTTNGTADAGESISYTLTATNSGNVSLSGVTIVDPRLPSLSCTPTQPAVLAVGASITCTGSYTVLQSDIDAQMPIANTATADSNETAPIQDTATVPVTTAGPMIGLSKQLLGASGQAPYTLDYQLRVRNHGEVSLGQVQVVDDLRQTFPAPIGIEVLALSASAGLTANAGYDGVIDTRLLVPAASALAVGAESTITLRVRLQPNGATGVFDNVAVATATAPDGSTTRDDSVDGANTDPDNNGIPKEQSPTPFEIRGVPVRPAQIPVDDPRALLLLSMLVLLVAAGALRRRG